MRRRLALLAIVLVVWIGWRVFRLAVGAPVEEVRDLSWLESTRVLSRDGRLLGERPSALGLRGKATTLADAGERLVKATLAGEDRRFFSHDGIDRRAMVRAALANVVRGRIVSGGSTLTQQLVKRIDHRGKPRPRTLAAKIVEVARAQNLEATLGKEEILEAYLNHLDYGRGLAGPEAAAQGYFGVHAKDLSLAQAALLAVLPRAPSALDPYRHRGRAVLRQRSLLSAMHEAGSISDEDLDRALSEPLSFRDRAQKHLLAPHLVFRSSRGVHGGGDVVTTIDFDLQRDVEALVHTHASRLRAHGARTAAVVIADVARSEVLAEVGSADWFDARIDGAVDLVHARRQPGSTLKPFVYALAIDRGASPMRMLPDVPTEFGSTYAPENFDGTFVGPVSLREALAGSLNVPAVKMAAEIGAEDLVSVLRSAGLSLPEGSARYGLSVALGSADVTPLELAEAYATLARGGEHRTLRELRELGMHAADHPSSAVARVFGEGAVAAVADALADPLARVRGLRTRGPFELPFPTAVKTGTSTAFRDAWAVGFTRERVVVVWVGNADGTATQKLTGAVGAGPLLTDVMNRAMRDVPERAALAPPDVLELAEVCPLSGDRPSHACSDRVMRRFPHGRTPTHECSLHRMASARSAAPGEPPFRCDEGGAERIVILPETYAGWLAVRPLGAPSHDPKGLLWFLATRVPGCGAPTDREPRITVSEPHDGAVVYAARARGSEDAVDVAADTEGLAPHERLELVVDGRVALAMQAPYRARLPIARGDHLLEVRPADPRLPAILGRARIRVR